MELSPKARYEHWWPAVIDGLVAVGLCVILAWLGPSVCQWLSTIPDPGEEMIIFHRSPTDISWWELFFSRRSVGVLLFLILVGWLWSNRANVNLMRFVRWTAFGLIVIDLLVTGKPQVIIAPPLIGGTIEMTMGLYKILVRQAVCCVSVLAVVLLTMVIVLKNLQMFLLGVQAGGFLVLEYISCLVFGRDELGLLACVGCLAACFHLDMLLPAPERDLAYWLGMVGAFLVFLAINAVAFYWLVWPYLAKAEIIVVPAG